MNEQGKEITGFLCRWVLLGGVVCSILVLGRVSGPPQELGPVLLGEVPSQLEDAAQVKAAVPEHLEEDRLSQAARATSIRM